MLNNTFYLMIRCVKHRYVVMIFLNCLLLMQFSACREGAGEKYIRIDINELLYGDVYAVNAIIAQGLLIGKYNNLIMDPPQLPCSNIFGEISEGKLNKLHQPRNHLTLGHIQWRITRTSQNGHNSTSVLQLIGKSRPSPEKVTTWYLILLPESAKDGPLENINILKSENGEVIHILKQ